MIDSLSVRAILTGILFGIWPLLMNRSGLSGNISSLVLAAGMMGCVLCVLPFSVNGVGDIFDGNVKLMFAIGASILGAVGMIIFNGILAETTPQTVSSLIVLVFVTQIIVPSIYNLIVTGELTITKCAGFAFAIIAAILLNLQGYQNN